jgi:hypothetical protein
MNPVLMIGFDNGSGDIPVLTVGAKKSKDKLILLNVFKGDEAKELYTKLVTPSTLAENTEVDI